MSAIDISKIKPGDKVTVSYDMTVTATSAHGIAGKNDRGEIGDYRVADISSHTPAPRPIAVGDLVVYRCGHPTKVRAIDAGEAWINHGIVPVDQLLHADPSP